MLSTHKQAVYYLLNWPDFQFINKQGDKMAAIKTFFQVMTKSKKTWMRIGELVSYNMDTVFLKFDDGKVRSYLHSEVKLFNTIPDIEPQPSEDRYHRKGDPVVSENKK